MREQAVTAMELADVIVFAVDGVKKVWLRQTMTLLISYVEPAREIILVVNKVIIQLSTVIIFMISMNWLGLVAISSVNMLNIGDLLDAIVAGFPDEI